MASRLMGNERRQAPRASERIRFTVADAGPAFETETRNLSASGAYCTMDRFIAPMTKLALEFQLPIEPRAVRIRCTGVVVRAEPVVVNAETGRYHVAIFFSDLSSADRASISRFVQQRLDASPARGA